MLRRTFIIALAAGALLATTAGAALASEAAPTTSTLEMTATQAVVELDVIHATKDGAVDRKLARLDKTLRRAFKGYKGFTRLDGQRVTAAKGVPQRLALLNNIKLEYTFESVGRDGRLSMRVNVGGMSSTVKVRDGGVFFQAGRGHQGGMIVLAFRVTGSN